MQAFSSPVPSSSSSSSSSSCERDGEQTDADRDGADADADADTNRDGADADGEKGEKGELEEKEEKEETLVAGLARIAPAGRDMGNALRTSCFLASFGSIFLLLACLPFHRSFRFVSFVILHSPFSGFIFCSWFWVLLRVLLVLGSCSSNSSFRRLHLRGYAPSTT